MRNQNLQGDCKEELMHDGQGYNSLVRFLMRKGKNNAD